MDTPFVIKDCDSLRNFIQNQIFGQPTSYLLQREPNGLHVICEETNRVWCVEAVWMNVQDIDANLKKLTHQELEWRETPWRTELKPTIIN